jgi:WD40 repeat protein
MPPRRRERFLPEEAAMRLQVGWLFPTALVMIVSNTTFAPPLKTGWQPPVLAHAEFSTDGKLVLAQFYQLSIGRSGRRGQTCLYDAVTGGKLTDVPDASYNLTIHPDSVHLLFVKGSDELIRRSEDLKIDSEEVVLWNWKTRRVVRKFQSVPLDVASLSISPDGQLAFTGYFYKPTLVWDVATGKRVRAFDSPARIRPFFFLDGGKRAVTGNVDCIKVWDVASGKQLAPWFDEYDKSQEVSAHHLCACSPDGRYLCTALGGGDRKNPRIRVWDLKSGNLLHGINLPKDDYSYIAGASFAENGRVLLAVDEVGYLHAWDVVKGKHLWSKRVVKQKEQEIRGVTSATFSQDGRLLLTRGDGTTMQLWDTAKRAPIWSAGIEGTK